MNYEAVTVQDCIDNYEKRNKSVVIKDGQVIGFELNEQA